MVDLNLLKDASFLGVSTGRNTTCIKVLEPSSFDGVQNTKTLKSFIWDMEQYFKAAKFSKVKQLSLVGLYLTGDAKL